MSDEPDFLVQLVFKPDAPGPRPTLGEMQLLLAYVIPFLQDLLDAEQGEDE